MLDAGGWWVLFAEGAEAVLVLDVVAAVNLEAPAPPTHLNPQAHVLFVGYPDMTVAVRCHVFHLVGFHVGTFQVIESGLHFRVHEKPFGGG